jgi:hypothetical protein
MGNGSKVGGLGFGVKGSALKFSVGNFGFRFWSLRFQAFRVQN